MAKNKKRSSLEKLLDIDDFNTEIMKPFVAMLLEKPKNQALGDMQYIFISTLDILHFDEFVIKYFLPEHTFQRVGDIGFRGDKDHFVSTIMSRLRYRGAKTQSRGYLKIYKYQLVDFYGSI